MDNDERITCWLYSVINKDRFAGIMSREGIDLILDAGSQTRVDEVSNLISRRVGALSAVRSRPFGMDLADDVRSFNFVRMVSAVARSGSSSWFAQKEAELFQSRLKSVPLMHFLNDIMFDRRVIEPARTGDAWLCKDRSPGSSVKVRWEAFSDLAADRKHSIRDGWIYIDPELVIPEVAKVFRAAIESSIADTRKKLQNTPELKGVLENFSSIIEAVPGYSESAVRQDAPVLEIFSMSPPCMRVLDDSVSRGVDIGYTAYLILSFYLKTFMTREALVAYFFERNPENARSYADVSDYLTSRRDLDYIFKQMFGEAGGGANYVSFACKRIHDERVCPFCDTSRIVDVVNSIDGQTLDTLRRGPRERVLEIIRDLSRSGNFKRACGLEFQLRFFTFYIAARLAHGSEIDKKKYIVYPVGYFQHAAAVLEKRARASAEESAQNRDENAA